jgi:6,7-dimethyl-8-ribityllumazine synthase
MSRRASEAAIDPIVGRVRFAVLAARFNEEISGKLLDGALSAFATHGVPRTSVDVHWVPGSFELPQAALALARTRRYAGIVCLGVVIKGETPHYDYVARAAAEGIGRAALDTGVPISFGVITALTEEQAWARAGGAVGNRGAEAALATLQMAGWLHGIRTTRASARNTGLRASRRDARRG